MSVSGVRRKAILGSCAAALVASVASAPAASVAPAAEVVALRMACARGDAHELARAAGRLGARGLANACGSADRADVLAAITAAPLAEPAWALLDPLTELLDSPDRPVAAAAARAVAAIVHELVLAPEQLTGSGAPIDELARAADACATIAARAGVWPDVRVHALECALGLAAGLGDDASAAARALPASLFTDAEPEVRRAAVALADAEADDAGGALLAGLAAVVADDPDAAVAASAAATLCRDGHGLSPAGRERARKLIADPLVDPGDAVSLRRCTRAPR